MNALIRHANPTFHAVCVFGLAVAVVLTAYSMANPPPIKVTDTDHRVVDRTLIIEADVTNRSDVARCPDMRGVAEEEGAKTLAEVTARPTTGGPRLEPGATVRFRATITTLTEEELTEKLRDQRIYPYESPACP